MTLPLKIGGETVEPAKDSAGEPIPHAYTFASVVQTWRKVYSHRYDEAIKHNRENALAMWRDVYIRALLQERWLPVAKLNWSLETDDNEDPAKKQVVESLTECLQATWRWRRLCLTLLKGEWYGRYGAQVQWEKDPRIGNRYKIARHLPVNGDKIQYEFDGTPLVMIHSLEAARLNRETPGITTITTAGAYALRLATSEYRDRFVIHQHDADDADYYEGEMSGGVNGVGLRSVVYWAYYLRQEMLDWMVSAMEALGTTSLAVVNYEQGNAAAKQEAENQAKLLPGKTVFLMPRARGEKYATVEMIPLDMAGIDTLKTIIDDYFDVQIERLIVGQSLSSDSEGSGLGGTGVASFHADTKYQIIDWSAHNLAETLTEQVVEPCRRLNNLEGDFPVRLAFSVPDPDSDKKLETAKTLKELGIAFKADDVRKLTPFGKPEEGDEQVGGGIFSSSPGGFMSGQTPPELRSGRATTGGGGLDVQGLLDRMPAGGGGGNLDVQGLLDRLAIFQAELSKLLRG